LVKQRESKESEANKNTWQLLINSTHREMILIEL